MLLLACMHARHRCDMDWRRCSKIPGVSQIVAAVMDVQVHFRINEHVVNCGSERSMFRQVLMYPSERLMFRLPPRWISFSIQLNSNTSISVG
ncbi:hypothetical protein TNCV_4208791 [Trichonephila clavipes]|nr:hypothetical protein TNCV_4208791 [Trichonephila clavipes]